MTTTHRVLSPVRPFAHSPFRLPLAVAFELDVQGYFLLLNSALEIASTDGVGCLGQALPELAELAQKFHFLGCMPGALEQRISQTQFFGPTKILIQIEWLPGAGQTLTRILRQPFLNFLFDRQTHTCQQRSFKPYKLPSVVPQETSNLDQQ